MVSVPTVEEIQAVVSQVDAATRDDLAGMADAAGVGSFTSFPATEALPLLPPSAYGTTETDVIPDGEGGVNNAQFVTVSGIKVRDYVGPYLVGMLFEAATDPAVTGPVGVTSSYRSTSKQRELYRRRQRYEADPAGYLADNNNKVPAIAARPGTSKHEFGLAIDFNINIGGMRRGSYNGKDFDAMKALAAIGEAYGFKRTVRSEPWHFEFLGEEAVSELRVSKVTSAALNQLIIAIGQNPPNAQREVYNRYYSNLQKVKSSLLLRETSRAEHYIAASTEREKESAKNAKKNSTLTTHLIKCSGDDIPLQGASVGLLYNFDTGLWSDQKTGGKFA